MHAGENALVRQARGTGGISRSALFPAYPGEIPGPAFDFGVDWGSASCTIVMDTDRQYA